MKFDNRKDFDDWVMDNYSDLVRYWWRNTNRASPPEYPTIDMIKVGQIYLQCLWLGDFEGNPINDITIPTICIDETLNSLTVLYITGTPFHFKNIENHPIIQNQFYKTTVRFKMRMMDAKIQKVWDAKIKWKVAGQVQLFLKDFGRVGYWYLYGWDGNIINWINRNPMEVKE
jgi:hypothetical protein